MSSTCSQIKKTKGTASSIGFAEGLLPQPKQLELILVGQFLHLFSFCFVVFGFYCHAFLRLIHIHFCILPDIYYS